MAGQENLAQEALEIVEEQVEVVEKSASLLVRILWNHKTHIVTAAVVAGAVGAVAGWKYADKKLATQFQELLDVEIENTRAYYATLYKDKSPEQILREKHGDVALAEVAAEAARSYSGLPDAESPAEEEEELMGPEEEALYKKNGVDPRPPVEDVVQTIERRNIFDGIEPFDFDRELPLRGEVDPYIITREEYYQNETEFEQTDLIWYDGDGVLADMKDEMIPEVEKIVGEDPLGRFGYGSDDKNVVFVRNPRIEVEFEITRNFGKYSVLILDLPDEDEEGGTQSMKHSAIPPGKRRFRERDS